MLLTSQEIEALFVRHVGRFGPPLRFDDFRASAYYRFARELERQSARRAELERAETIDTPPAGNPPRGKWVRATLDDTGIVAALFATLFPGR